MVQFAFDASTIAPAEAGLPVWEGPVPVQIMRTETKSTAANNGSHMLYLHVLALAGEYHGQENVIRLNLWNSNAQAVDIAQRQLSSIAHAVNRIRFTDTDQLIGGQFLSVWAKEARDIMDQATGVKKSLESCQCKDFRMLDGRTIREAMSGQPASQPYDPNARSAAPAQQPTQSGAAAPNMQQQFQPQGGQATPPNGQGFQPPGQQGMGQQPMQGGQPGAQPGFQPPMQQPGAAPYQAGAFAPQGPGGPAPAPSGFQPPQQPGSGIGTAGYPSNPAQPPQGGFQAPQPGFQPPQGQAQPQAGFQPPSGPQPGAGPWNPNAPR